MASRSQRDIITSIAFAHGLGEIMKKHYLENKPNVKKIHPLLNDLIDISFNALTKSMKGVTMKDVKIIEQRITEFEKTGHHLQPSYQVIVGQVIGQISERISILTANNGCKEKISMLEDVLDKLEKIYSYFELRVKRIDFEIRSTNAFMAWEATA